MQQTGQGEATGGIRGAEVPAPTLEASDPMRAAAGGRLPADERDALRARRREAQVEDDADTPTLGLALSGGGIRSATFCLGLLRGMARRGLLSRFDYLSTVSGGGYIGAMFGRLVGRVGIAEAEHILAASDSRPLAWLRRYGRYLAPRGARDYGMGAATYLRAMVAVHLEFAFLALAAGLAVVLPHALHRQAGLFLIEAWQGWASAWWPLAAGLWLAAAPGLLGVYWMLRDPAAAGDEDPRAPVRPRFRLWDLAVVLAAAGAGGALLAGWAQEAPDPWSIPYPGWQPLLGLALVSLGLCGVAVWLRLLWAPRAETARATIARLRRTMTGGLRAVNVAVAALALLGLFDWASWTLLDLLRGSPGRLYGGLGAGGVLLIALRALMEPLQKWLGGGAHEGAQLVPLITGALGYALAFVLLVLWTTLVQWVVFLPDFNQAALGETALSPVPGLGALDGLADGALWRWMACAATLAVWFAFTGTNAESANTTSLHNMYAARLVRAYLGAVNDRRMAGGAGDGPRSCLAATAEGTSPEILSDVTAVHPDDDLPLSQYDPSTRGGPIHLVNVCLNQTRGHRSGLYNADRKGVPLVASAHGLRIGRTRVPVDDPGRLGTLGRWVAISGAAASPGAGAYTTPGWASLLFLAGARLGYWLDMPGAARSMDPDARPPRIGSGEWWRDRWQATKMGRLASEFRAVYGGPLARGWYLSDGGHFDNTGVHALLERELDLIVLADCGADPRYEMADLENLVRKARIDFGADIEFYTGDDANALHHALCGKSPDQAETDRAIAFLSPESLADNTTTRGLMLARILYRADAEGRRKEGRLVVVKPNLHAALDMDLLAYARRNPRFPQQATGDQFFDEAQWESYHRLGEDIGAQLRRDWLLPLAGRERLSDPPRIRASRLQKDAPAAARPFWRMDAKGAAVGALSLGELFAVLAPAWQIYDRLDSEREQQRKDLVALVREGRRVYGSLSGAPDAARAETDGPYTVSRLKALVARFPRDSVEVASARRVLEQIERECAVPLADASEDRLRERAEVCGQLKAQESAQTRLRREYWARRDAEDTADKRNAQLARTIASAAPERSVELATQEVERQVRDLRAVNAVQAPTQAADEPAVDSTGGKPAPVWPPQGGTSTSVESGSAEAVKQACVTEAAMATRLSIQVFDEPGRQALLSREWKNTGLFVAAPEIENVAVTAAARGERPPKGHSQPTLVLHDASASLGCAEALGLWLARPGEGGGKAQPIRIRPLPKGYGGRPGVIELWWPAAAPVQDTQE